MDEPGEPARMDDGEDTDVEGGAPGTASSDDASADDASADDASADDASEDGPQLPPAVDLPPELALPFLREGDLEIVGRLVQASNTTLLVTITGDVPDRGVITAGAVYKAIRGERPLWDFPEATLAHREVAAHAVSEATGWQIVPPTVFREEGPLGPGMLQLWVETRDDVDILALLRSGDPRLRRIALFDAVVNNADRKGGHLLVRPDGLIQGVDHGVTFNVDPKLRTVLWNWRGTLIAHGRCWSSPRSVRSSRSAGRSPSPSRRTWTAPRSSRPGRGSTSSWVRGHSPTRTRTGPRCPGPGTEKAGGHGAAAPPRSADTIRIATAEREFAPRAVPPRFGRMSKHGEALSDRHSRQSRRLRLGRRPFPPAQGAGGTVPTWSVTIPPDMPVHVTSTRPAPRMIPAIVSGAG